MEDPIVSKNAMMNMRRRAFTLIEILVVIAIVSVIASIILVALSNARKRARDVRRKIDVTQLGRFLFASACYMPDAGAGDHDIAVIAAELTAKNPGYANMISQLPQDPLSGTAAQTNYRYQVTADATGCVLYANYENENEAITLSSLSAPTAGGGTGTLKAPANGWNGSPVYYQVGK